MCFTLRTTVQIDVLIIIINPICTNRNDKHTKTFSGLSVAVITNFFVLFVLFFYFQTWFLHVALADLKLLC